MNRGCIELTIGVGGAYSTALGSQADVFVDVGALPIAILLVFVHHPILVSSNLQAVCLKVLLHGKTTSLKRTVA